MSEKLSLSIQATLPALAELQARIAAFGEAQGWPADLLYQLELVVEELCVNVVNHGGDGSHSIDVSLASSDEAIVLDIVDDGRPFDPLTEAPPPDLDSDVEHRPVGGLGVFFVKQMMDEVSYRREGDRNHVHMSKRRAP